MRKFYTFQIFYQLCNFAVLQLDGRLMRWSELRVRRYYYQLNFCSLYFFNRMSSNNNSSQDSKDKKKYSCSTKSNLKSYSVSQKKPSFLESTIFDKDVLLSSQPNPRALQHILSQLKIRNIRNGPTYIEIVVMQRSQPDKNSKLTKKEQSFDVQSRQAEEYEQLNLRLTSQYQEFKSQMLLNPDEHSHNLYLDWLTQMEHKNFISWFMPMGDTSTYVHSISISHKTLALMGYTSQEAALELSEFKANGLKQMLDKIVSFLAYEAFNDFFWIYANTLCKFIEAKFQGSPSKAEISEQSEHTITNELIGKNQRRIRTDMKFHMPSPYIMCMQVLTVAKGQKTYEPKLEQDRKIIQQQLTLKNRAQLAHIIKFPKPNPEDRKLTRCSYVVIDGYLH